MTDEPCYYGCDAFGPNGTCSGCTGLIERDDGSVVPLDHVDPPPVSERARIVAWLRDAASDAEQRAAEYGSRGIYSVAESYSRQMGYHREIADMIERGDHLEPTK